MSFSARRILRSPEVLPALTSLSGRFGFLYATAIPFPRNAKINSQFHLMRPRSLRLARNYRAYSIYEIDHDTISLI